MEAIDLFDHVFGGENIHTQRMCNGDNHILVSVEAAQEKLGIIKAAHKAFKREGMITTSGNKTQIGNKIFIGHGHSREWRVLKDFISDQLHLPWDEFNRESVAGVSNTDRLKEMLDNAAMAFLVMTAEDETGDGKMQARLNVVHEAGLFQGRLGFGKAIILLEDGCEHFSNIDGLGRIQFPKNNVDAKLHEVQRVLEREGLLKRRYEAAEQIPPPPIRN